MNNLIYDITKEYDDMFKIIVYKNGFDPDKLADKNKKKLKKAFRTEDDLQRSVRRSRMIINDYVHCNDFNLFVTFTFSPKKVDRYDLQAVYMKMQGWLRRQSIKYSDFRYIIVPEKHKDGALHFHALFGGFDGDLKTTSVIQNSKRVYNISSFRFGFTNAQFLDEDRQKAIAYLCKYITKDMQLISNRRRYWCSKGLKKPKTFRNYIYDLGLHKYTTEDFNVHETEFNSIYEIDKRLISDLAI